MEPCMQVELPERAVPRAETPPYTGYGSWEDSMASVTHLIPKATQKDCKKLYEHDGKILRFKARFANPKAEDSDRVFVFSFNLADDSLSIHEPPQRNLGVVTGKFLEKGVHLNQATGRLFEPNDLVPGNVVKVYNHEFEILDTDEYTAKMFADPNTRHLKFDLEGVVQKLRESMRQQFPLARDIFRRFDSDHDGVMTLQEFKRALQKFSFNLADDEVTQIMRHFDSRRDGQVSYNEFCDALLDEDYTTSMLKAKPTMQKHHDADYAQRAKSKLEERTETDNVRAAVRAMGDVVYKHTAAFTKLFKEFSHTTHERTLNCEQIQQAFKQIGHAFNIDDVRRCVLFVLPEVDPDRVSYVDFLKAMVTSFHDCSANR
uniref:Calmodulin n=1 Tax=Alexandrium andersonii TaxID=327968 RepID=A0A7S2CNA9_9DINO